MGRLSAKLRDWGRTQTMSGFAHWCPGCDEAHTVWTTNAPGRPVWEWDGNVDKPTVKPSIRLFEKRGDTERTICHYFLRAGRIEFCGDSDHALKGQTVDLPDFPDHWGGFDD